MRPNVSDYQCDRILNDIIQTMENASKVQLVQKDDNSQLPSWQQLKAKILQAIKKDEQPEVFEALLADVSNFMTELKLTGQLAAVST